MGDLISRLKIVSITSCILSLGVLPAVVTLKNMTRLANQEDVERVDFWQQLQDSLPTAQQTSLGGLALFGATGSTMALHYVFGPYVLDMTKISLSGDSNSKHDMTTYQVTTRSVFGWKNRHTIRPLSDTIEKYQGFRPFANVSINGRPFYFHQEKLDEETRQIFFPAVENEEHENSDITSLPGQQQQPLHYREEGLNIKSGKGKASKDDDFW
jgi:hypothetical protein